MWSSCMINTPSEAWYTTNRWLFRYTKHQAVLLALIVEDDILDELQAAAKQGFLSRMMHCILYLSGVSHRDCPPCTCSNGSEPMMGKE